jgi:hypothetical protein
MADVETRPGPAPVIAMVVVILVMLGLGFWFLAKDPNVQDDKTVADAGEGLAPGAALVAEESQPEGRNRRSLGAGMGGLEAPLFEGRDIHDVPLGLVLDHAYHLSYDETRGHELRLPRNEKGQIAYVKIWPEAGASSLTEPTLRQGRIVARIESEGSYDNLGLADGLNFLWVEGKPKGGYRGVIIPATAFAPLHDLDRVSITEVTPFGVPLEKGAYWVDGNPWIACGRC